MLLSFIFSLFFHGIRYTPPRVEMVENKICVIKRENKRESESNLKIISLEKKGSCCFTLTTVQNLPVSLICGLTLPGAQDTKTTEFTWWSYGWVYYPFVNYPAGLPVQRG
jgi:hypothetical protein